MSELLQRVLKRINAQSVFTERYTRGCGHFVGCHIIDLGPDVRLECPMNGCPSWDVLVQGLSVGRIDCNALAGPLKDLEKRAKSAALASI